MGLFSKKCFYCKTKIDRGEEIEGIVKVPEFSEKVNRIFCSEEHLKYYRENITGTPSRSSCPYCIN